MKTLLAYSAILAIGTSSLFATQAANPNSPHAQNTATWQESYAELLRTYMMMELEDNPISWIVDSDGNILPNLGGYFLLFDFSGSGIPELIVVDRTHFTSYVAAYSFSCGYSHVTIKTKQSFSPHASYRRCSSTEFACVSLCGDAFYTICFLSVPAIIPLEVVTFYDYGTQTFNIPGRFGLGMESNEGVWNRAAVLVLAGERLVPKFELTRGEARGYGFDYYGEWGVVHEVVRHINGRQVSHEKHDAFYEAIFGPMRWYERDFVFFHRITEENIASLVSNWQLCTTPVRRPRPVRPGVAPTLRRWLVQTGGVVHRS